MLDNNVYLLGDTVTAQRYLPYARIKLDMLHRFMSMLDLPTANRLYRIKGTGVSIFIESNYGIDKIRIQVRKKEAE